MTTQFSKDGHMQQPNYERKKLYTDCRILASEAWKRHISLAWSQHASNVAGCVHMIKLVTCNHCRSRCMVQCNENRCCENRCIYNLFVFVPPYQLASTNAAFFHILSLLLTLSRYSCITICSCEGTLSPFLIREILCTTVNITETLLNWWFPQ